MTSIPYLLYGYCLLGLILSHEKLPIFHKLRWRLLFLWGFLALMIWHIVVLSAKTSSTGSALAGYSTAFQILMFYIFIPTTLIVPFIWTTWRPLIEALQTSFLSLHRIKPPKSYDLAEKAEHDQNFEEAIRQYQRYAAQTPDDPEPWRRIGEIHLSQGEPDQAIKNLEEALQRTVEEENKLLVGFRISDVLAQKLSQPARAREFLSNLASQIRHPKHARLIEDRLNMLG